MQTSDTDGKYVVQRGAFWRSQPNRCQQSQMEKHQTAKILCSENRFIHPVGRRKIYQIQWWNYFFNSDQKWRQKTVQRCIQAYKKTLKCTAAWLVYNGSAKSRWQSHKCVGTELCCAEQEIPLPLTNGTTHLGVSQGHRTIRYVRHGFLLEWHSNFVPKMRRFWDIQLWKMSWSWNPG